MRFSKLHYRPKQMFTLSAIFLEDGENLFQDFLSPFSISFICLFARNYLKKRNRLTGPCPTWTLRPGGFISRALRLPEAQVAPPPPKP